MGTNLINSIQHRNGPNQRPPNSIFGSSGASQTLISNHPVGGFLGAVSCAFVIVLYINYSLTHENSTGMKIFAVIGVSVVVILIFMTCVLLICRKNDKRVTVEYVEPSHTELTTDYIDNLILEEPSNIDMLENPPPYDHAIKMPSRGQKSPQGLPPPPYDNLVLA